MSTNAPTNNNKLKGIVFLARHGDRTEFFQDPTTYVASDTTITPLGEVQEFNLGSLLRSTYLNPAGAKFIQGINFNAANQSEIKVRADAGDEGGVIFDSSIALLQGLFPPNRQAESITLANGTTFTSPLGGYEYIPSEPRYPTSPEKIANCSHISVESVESAEDVSLEGHASCTVIIYPYPYPSLRVYLCHPTELEQPQRSDSAIPRFLSESSTSSPVLGCRQTLH